MSKDYFVLRGGRVVYPPGHYGVDGATAVAKSELERHPKATVRVVKIVAVYGGPDPDKIDK